MEQPSTITEFSGVDRLSLAHDRHRPLYHFLPAANWMNDPNGFIHVNGRYHLFYQYNPAGAFHGVIHWGHAVSRDLVYWEDRPTALSPTPGGPDAGGCWSGSAVIADGQPVIFYTGVHPQTVCLAYGSADLDIWMKHSANPVIAGPPPGIDAGEPADFRDPYVWRQGDWWYMLMAARRAGVGGVVLIYRSADLLHWEYLHPLMSGDESKREPFWTGSVWECANLVPVGGRHVLIISFQDQAPGDLLYVGYWIGDFRDGRFTADGDVRILEYGGRLYAPQAIVDEAGRTLLLGWLLEGRSKAAYGAAGWAGVMSLPRILALGDDGTLRMRPVPEFRALRREHVQVSPRTVRPGENNVLAGVRGDCLEIDAVLEPEDATAFGLHVRCSPDGAERTTVLCDVTAGTVTIDRRRSSQRGEEDGSNQPIPAAVESAPLSEGGPVCLHVFLDRSVVEVFVDDRVVLSGRVYPSREDSLGVALFTKGGALRIGSLDVWQIAAVWPVKGATE